MRRSRLCCCLFVALLGHTGCAQKMQPDPLVASVDGSALTESDLRAALPVDLNDAAPVRLAHARSELIQRWVDRELLYQEALSRHLQDQARVKTLLSASRHSILVAALIDAEFDRHEVRVEEADIQQYYAAHLADFQRSSSEIHVRHILLSSRRDANARLQSLKRGESFAQLAEEYSLDPDTRFQGGDLGFFSADEDPVLWAACEQLPLNRISKPIRTQYGYHLFEVLERQEAATVRPITQVRKQIIAAMVKQRQQQQLDSLLTRLRSTHEWSITATSADTL